MRGGYSLSMEDVPAEAAIAAVNAIAEVGVIFEPARLEGKRTTCTIADASVEGLLSCVLDGTGLTFRRLPSGAFAVVEQQPLENAPALQARTTSQSRSVPARLTGFITDASDGQPLAGSTIALHTPGAEDEAPLYGTAANGDGFYLIAGITPGTYLVTVSFVGYASVRDTLGLTADARASFDAALPPAEAKLGEVLIRGAREHDMARVTAGHQRIRPQDVGLVPSPDVSSDLANYMTALPSVVTTGDRGGQLYVRGGEPSQNLVLLDGMVIYQPLHVLGFYSAFPTDILSTVDFHAGGFPARYAGRLSSVLDVASRNGNNRRFAGKASASPFMSSVQLEGPLVPDHASFMLSARESLLERGGEPILGEELPFRFGDLFAKVYGPVTRTSRMSVTALRTHDRSTIGEDSGASEEIRWRNEAIGLKWMFVPSMMPAIMNVSLSRSRHHTEFGPDADPIRISSIEHTRISASASFERDRSSWDGGWEVLLADATNHLDGTFQLPETSASSFVEFGFYLQPTYQLGGGLRVTPSLRLQWYNIKIDPYFEPRLRATWDLGAHHLSAAAGLYNQEVIGITDSRDVANTFTVWSVVPRLEGNEENPLAGRLARAAHGLIGYRGALLPGLDVSIEGYYKSIANLFAAEWTAFPSLTTQLQQAEGSAMGMDARLEVRRGNLYGHVNYGLSSTRYRTNYEAIRYWFESESFTFRPPHDRRHQVNALVGSTWSGFDFNVRWTFGSGFPFTRPLGFDSFAFVDRAVSVTEMIRMRRVIYDRPFGDVLPTYHRLDVALARTFSFAAADVTLQGSLINVYDRRNLFYLDIFTMQRQDQLPFVPSFGIEVSFE